jgi:hypothetical protein
MNFRVFFYLQISHILFHYLDWVPVILVSLVVTNSTGTCWGIDVVNICFVLMCIFFVIKIQYGEMHGVDNFKFIYKVLRELVPYKYSATQNT